jgi:phosphate transport system substrate-binding protein
MRRLTVLVLGFLAVQLEGQGPSSLPAYQPEQRISGTLRSWGNDRMQPLMTRWENGFRKHHPDVRFETTLRGTGTAIAGLYTGVADLALMGRPVSSTESMAFEWVFRYKPLGVQVSTGSLAVTGKSYAPVVFVHKDNPLSQLTLPQLDAVFGCEHLRGTKNVRTWGDLGLTGEWSTRPIHSYGPDIQSSTASFFRETVLKGSYKWSCDMKELADVQVLDGLAKDRAGIAYSALGYLTQQVKPLALSLEDGKAYYLPTVENVRERKYPLTRATWIFVNRQPERPLDAKVREFLRYVLSRDGQRDVEQEGDYLPLRQDVLLAQLRQVP